MSEARIGGGPAEDGRLTSWTRFCLVLLPALLGPAQLFLFGPFTTFARNQSEFVLGFWSLAACWLWASALLVALLAAVGASLPRRWLQRYVAVLFAAGILLWVQGNLLVPDYGPLYGGGPDSDSASWRNGLELGLWGTALALVVVFARPVSTIAPFASGVLLALQLIALLLPGTGVPQAQDRAPRAAAAWSEPPAAVFELSRRRNVIHLVLDAFASEIFAEAMERDRAAFDRDYSGFVFFADHLGAFPTTRASMPAMTAGVAYRNEEPFDDFRDRVLREKSVFSLLAGRGYGVHAITFNRGEYPPASPSLPIVGYQLPTPYADRRTYERFAAAEVLDLTLFRHAPGGTRRGVYNDGRWLIQQWTGSAARQARQSNHVTFFDDLASRLSVVSEQPVYLFVHVIPPHPPIMLDSSCGFGRQPLTRESFAGQAACVLAHVGAFLDRLRALGVYDRSAILLTADHGWPLRRRNHPLRGILTPADRLDLVAGAAMPLLAVKPPLAAGPVRTSLAPTSVLDIPATIAGLAGIPSQGLPGRPVFEIDPDAPRLRTFTHHTWKRLGWWQQYFDPLLVFEVNGRALDRGAWRFKEALLDPTGDADAARDGLESGLAPVQDVDGERVRRGATYAVTYAPPDARALSVSARRQAGTAARAAIAVRVDGQPAGRLQLGDDGWHTWTRPLDPHADRRSPFCIELLAERAADGPRGRLRTVLYRPTFWTR